MSCLFDSNLLFHCISLIGQEAELSSYDSWDPICGFVLLHVLGVGLVRGGCKRWPCGFVDRPGIGRIGGWVLVDCPEGCWSPTLGLSPYCVPREVICQWMTAEEVLILAINNLRAIRRQLAFWTCGPLTGFWCCHSTGKKKQRSASLFFVRQRHTARHFVIATGAEPGTSNSPGVSGVHPILFSAVFFLGGDSM